MDDNITYHDDWTFKSDGERRRWALQAVGLHISDGRSIENCIADADAVVAYINGPSVSVPDQPSASSDLPQTADMPAQPLLAAT